MVSVHGFSHQFAFFAENIVSQSMYRYGRFGIRWSVARFNMPYVESLIKGLGSKATTSVNFVSGDGKRKRPFESPSCRNGGLKILEKPLSFVVEEGQKNTQQFGVIHQQIG